MFQIWNSVYSATIRFEIGHPQAKEIYETLPLKDYIDNHYDYMVRLRYFGFDPYKNNLILQIYMERAFQNEARFIDLVKKDFLPSIKDYINYTLTVLASFDAITDWGTFSFEVGNLQKETGYRLEQVGDGARVLYQDTIETNFNTGVFLQSGNISPD